MVIHLQGRVWHGRRWIEVPFETLVANHRIVGEGRAHSDAGRGCFDKLDVAAIIAEYRFNLESPKKFPQWVLVQPCLGLQSYWECIFYSIKSVGWIDNDGNMGVKGRAFVEGWVAGLERYQAERGKGGSE